MKTWLQKNDRLVFYLLWIVLALIQASLTELQDDEAYYWVYSKFPAWGYFDHPPMIAMIVKMGYALIPNELGIRLIPLLMNIGTLLLIEKLTGRKNSSLFYAIALSIAVLQLAGFMAVPDIPLIFFTALFFYIYKKLLDKPGFVNSLLLGISITLLFYSKYHALLIVFFTLISNLKLFKRYHIWMAGLVALALYAPHLWWQYQHNWISFKYHLFESNNSSYKISYTLEYLLGQILMAGPIVGFILLPAAFICKTPDPFLRSLKFTLIGIYLFFFLSSFRGRVEANWTSPVLVPLIILSFHYLQEYIRWKKLLFQTLPVSLVLILFGRIVQLEDILPVRSIRERYHAWSDWPALMKEKTKGLPVVFSNYYQYASKYWFYTGQLSLAQSFYKIRKNNYNFWPIEDSLLGKQVYILDKHRLYLFSDSIKTPLGYIGYRYDSSFASFSNLKIEVTQKKYTVREGEPVRLICHYTIPGNYKQFLATRPLPPDTVGIGFFRDKKYVTDIWTNLKLKSLDENKPDTLNVITGLPKGKYVFRFSVHIGDNYPTHNSENFALDIK